MSTKSLQNDGCICIFPLLLKQQLEKSWINSKSILITTVKIELCIHPTKLGSTIWIFIVHVAPFKSPSYCSIKKIIIDFIRQQHIHLKCNKLDLGKVEHECFTTTCGGREAISDVLSAQVKQIQKKKEKNNKAKITTNKRKNAKPTRKE